MLILKFVLEQISRLISSLSREMENILRIRISKGLKIQDSSAQECNNLNTKICKKKH